MIKIPNASKIVSLISEINHIYAEKIKIYRIKSKQYCPKGHYDPIRKVATDTSCPLCNGKGVIYEYEILEIPANVDYNDDIDIVFEKTGTVLFNELLISIDKKEIEVFNIDVNNISYIEYDNLKYKIKNYRKEFLEGILYELVLLVERSENL